MAKRETARDTSGDLDALREMAAASDFQVKQLTIKLAAAEAELADIKTVAGGLADLNTQQAETIEDAERHLEAAWGIIANAFGGNWQKAGAEWRGAAERWRDEYHVQARLTREGERGLESAAPR